MKLTADFERGQHAALLRRGRPNIVLAKACFCEAIAERILEGESPANLHKWAFHEQPPKFLKSFLRSFAHSAVAASGTTRAGIVHAPPPLGPFSQSATQIWPVASGDRPGGAAAGQQQYGHHSFDSLERSVAEMAESECAHSVLFGTILGADRTGYLTLLQNWGILLSAVRDSRGQCLMHWAVQRQSTECMLELFTLQRGGGAAREWVLARDNRGITPVHLAAAQDSARVLNMLLAELGLADLPSAATDQDGMNPLHHAAAAGSASCCEQLLSEQWELPVDVRDAHGRTPLHHAAWSKFAANVFRLLANKKRIAVSARDERGWTPLHTAVVANNEAVLRVLLHELRVDPQIFDHESRTPLHYAALHDRTELARLLIEYGASNDTRDRSNVTPAHYAAQCATYETLRTILNSTTTQTAQVEGVQRGRNNKCADVVFGLSGDRRHQQLNEWAVAEPSPQPLDNEGRTPFMWAVIAQNQSVVQQMLLDKNIGAAGRLITGRDVFKRTPLHLAALVGNLELCKLLVNEGHLNVNDGDMHGATPEHLAAGQGNSEVVLWFGYIRGGHVKPPMDLIDRTPFLYACLGGQANTVEAMLRSLHVDPRHVDSLGCSALHCAVISGSLHCVRALVESKSGSFDLFLEDKECRTGLDIAMEQQLAQIAHYLEAKMAMN